MAGIKIPQLHVGRRAARKCEGVCVCVGGVEVGLGEAWKPRMEAIYLYNLGIKTSATALKHSLAHP
jgi:hypothetical protein